MIAKMVEDLMKRQAETKAVGREHVGDTTEAYFERLKKKIASTTPGITQGVKPLFLQLTRGK